MKSSSITIALIVAFTLSDALVPSARGQERKQAPVTTQWVLDAVGPTGRNAVKSLYMIVCPKTSMKGSGFLVDNGVTNEHVVHGCSAAELYADSSFGERIAFSSVRVDAVRDLAGLSPLPAIPGGLALARNSSSFEVGTVVRTWGYPLGYNGPAPLLSVGYLSGFSASPSDKSRITKHLIVNAAFNSGNSGGPLFAKAENEVVGVVVSKALPIFSPFVQSAVQAFANNRSGVVFTGTGADGKPITMVESQVVAEVVGSLRDMAQVMIGEAIAVEEVAAFLAYKYPTSQPKK
ncbi:MAG: trypsin-like peptidase domain-containing protein [Acidobacteria bacterium]|nr:trypsin-like peptidase domain-containing protein [Acidobacteriota bacterium]